MDSPDSGSDPMGSSSFISVWNSSSIFSKVRSPTYISSGKIGFLVLFRIFFILNNNSLGSKGFPK